MEFIGRIAGNIANANWAPSEQDRKVLRGFSMWAQAKSMVTSPAARIGSGAKGDYLEDVLSAVERECQQGQK
jgi:hypothetical protein